MARRPGTKVEFPTLSAGEFDFRARWRAVRALADLQRGVVTFTDMRRLGFRENMIQRLLDSERLIQIHQGVYAVGHTALREGWREQAAAFAAGPESALAHRSAAAWRGYVRPRGEVHVVIPSQNGNAIEGLVVHRCATLEERDIEVIDGLRVTRAARTAIDIAASEPALLPRILREMELRREDFGRIYELLAATPRRRGSRRLLGELDRFVPQVADLRSDLEVWFVDLIERNGLQPPTSSNSIVEGQLVDFSWEELGVVVELDHQHTHAVPSAFNRDRARTNELQVAGRTALRFTDTMPEEEIVRTLFAAGVPRIRSVRRRTKVE